MACVDNKFQGLSKSLEKGFLVDDIILDIAKRQEGKPCSSNPAELYKRAIDLCLDERRHDVLIELMRLRDGRGVTEDQLTRVRKFFFKLNVEYTHQTDDYSVRR